LVVQRAGILAAPDTLMLLPIDARCLGEISGGNARTAGTRLGLQLGVAVTEGLRYLPSYRAAVPGMRSGAREAFEKRHRPVIGPLLDKVVPYLPAGKIRDFGAGLAAGATEAPGWTYFIGR
jgi:hypothetical protein